MPVTEIGAGKTAKPQLLLERVGDQVHKVIAAELGLPFTEVTREARLREDFAVDSFNLLELAMRLEAALDIGIPDNVLIGAQTVADLEDFIRERMDPVA